MIDSHPSKYLDNFEESEPQESHSLSVEVGLVIS